VPARVQPDGPEDLELHDSPQGRRTWNRMPSSTS
jgi:hypothetical protein